MIQNLQNSNHTNSGESYMDRYNMEYSRSDEQIIVVQNNLVRQVYAWMGMGLALNRPDGAGYHLLT